jgi:uncharacterized membrane protein
MEAGRGGSSVSGAAQREPQVFLDTVLQPYRSLPPRGFATLMAVLGGLSVMAGVGCVLAGAWPVIGFFGLDVLLVYLAFRLSYRGARLREIVRLTDRALTVERVSPAGERRCWQFEPYWLRVVFEDRDDPGPVTLASHGRALAVGSFLAPEQRRSLAASLRGALAHWRAFMTRV